jgi:hypothetical protein
VKALPRKTLRGTARGTILAKKTKGSETRPAQRSEAEAAEVGQEARELRTSLRRESEKLRSRRPSPRTKKLSQAEQQAMLAAFKPTKPTDMACKKCGRSLAFVEPKERVRLADGGYACAGCPDPKTAPATAPVVDDDRAHADDAPENSKAVADALAQIAKWDESERKDVEHRAAVREGRIQVTTEDPFAEARVHSTGYRQRCDVLMLLNVFADIANESDQWKVAREDPMFEKLHAALEYLQRKLAVLTDGMDALRTPAAQRTAWEDLKVAAADKTAGREVRKVKPNHEGIILGSGHGWGWTSKEDPADGGYRRQGGKWAPNINQKVIDADEALVTVRALRHGLILARARAQNSKLSMLEALKAVEKEHHALWRMHLGEAIEHAGQDAITEIIAQRRTAEDSAHRTSDDPLEEQALAIARHALSGFPYFNEHAMACGSRTQADDADDAPDELTPLRRAVRGAEKASDKLAKLGNRHS